MKSDSISILSILLFAALACASMTARAQVYSDKVVGKKNVEAIDSIKNAEYPYVLPILGKKATAAGFSLPYSAGVGINYLWQESDLVIENLQVGFNNNPMRDLSEVVRFNTRSLLLRGSIYVPISGFSPFSMFTPYWPSPNHRRAWILESMLLTRMVTGITSYH